VSRCLIVADVCNVSRHRYVNMSAKRRGQFLILPKWSKMTTLRNWRELTSWAVLIGEDMGKIFDVYDLPCLDTCVSFTRDLSWQDGL
jgi:hypothetical protein